METYKGIDISKWQGEINWSRVKNSGINFVMIRATFGGTNGQKDARFIYNYNKAKEVGLNVGAYHFAYATTVEEARAEAKYCMSVLKGKKFEYPIAYDLEDSRIEKLGKEKISAIAKAFCEEMEKNGYYVAIYSNLYWLNHYFTDDIFKKYDIWLAQWAEKPTFQKTYGIWQKSSKGKVDGIDTLVDLNEAYKNYPAIMKYNGLNGYGKEVEAAPPKRGYSAGQKVVLKNAKLYSSAMTERVSGTISGTYYVYDGIYIEGRYRITNSLKNVERVPISKYVTGFVERKDLGWEIERAWIFRAKSYKAWRKYKGAFK